MKTLGQKLRAYRKRTGLSQFDLELAIDASPGSISRIENDLVNPTKETIGKISRVLSLNSIEEASLYGIDFYERAS